jgi:hypothetical protein
MDKLKEDDYMERLAYTVTFMNEAGLAPLLVGTIRQDGTWIEFEVGA